MATQLIDLEIEEVSCVDAGANPHAPILLTKRAEPIEKKELGTEVAAKSGKGEPLEKTEPTVEQLQAELKKARENSAAVDELRKELKLQKETTETELAKVKAEAATEKTEREALQKRNDELAKQAKEEKDARLLVEFAKRADEKIPNLSGTSTEKGKLLKSLDENLPKEESAAVMALLEAGDAAMGKQFRPVGKSGDVATGSAQEKLQSLAKARQAEKSITYSKALDQVSRENPDLYAEYTRDRRAN